MTDSSDLDSRSLHGSDSVNVCRWRWEVLWPQGVGPMGQHLSEAPARKRGWRVRDGLPADTSRPLLQAPRSFLTTVHHPAWTWIPCYPHFRAETTWTKSSSLPHHSWEVQILPTFAFSCWCQIPLLFVLTQQQYLVLVSRFTSTWNWIRRSLRFWARSQRS